MGHKVWFSERDITDHNIKTKEAVVRKEVLFFHFEETAKDGVPGRHVEDVASEQHKKDYPGEYQAFLKSKEAPVQAPVEKLVIKKKRD